MNTNDTFKVINHSKHKEWVVSGPVSERFMNSLFEDNENFPDKVYYGYGNFEEDYRKIAGIHLPDSYSLSNIETTYQFFLLQEYHPQYSTPLQKGTEEQIKNWHIVFYSPTDPYAEGGASSIDNNPDIEYWYHDDGSNWYRNQYTVTPKTWEKPQS